MLIGGLCFVSIHPDHSYLFSSELPAVNYAATWDQYFLHVEIELIVVLYYI